MLPTIGYLKDNLARVIATMAEQGYDTGTALERLEKLPPSYDRLVEFAEELNKLPMRKDWPYTEPNLYEEIEKEMAPDRHPGLCKQDGKDTERYARKGEAAFLGSVLGCILGKPVEINPSYEEMKKAGQSCGEWPLADFISEEFLTTLGRRHPSWVDTTKGNIRYAAADDDLHYSIMGMINLENYGLALDYDGVKNTWLNHQCMNFVFGPERTINTYIAVHHLCEGYHEPHRPNEYYRRWGDLFNPQNELCGAAIRADAYGYAFPGQPGLAAQYAFVDASFTHRRTGVYSAMYLAAAIALMFVAKEPLEAFEEALKFVPQRSRFYQITKTCLDYVKVSESFEDGYERIHHRFGQYDHCKVYQEIGTLMNTLRYATDIWDGVCKQVMQGNDTDSFGCTAGSLLGAFFGYEGLPVERLALFNDNIQVSLASFHEHSLMAIAKRMGNLSRTLASKEDPVL